MKTLNFAKRNFKSIIRDPLSLIFAIILPLFLLFIFKQLNIPNEAYLLENFTPGIIIFSFSFITMFTAVLVAKDRTTSLLTRLGVSPMKSTDFIFGYMLSVIPIIFIQNILLISLAAILGLSINLYTILGIIISFLISILFIALGLLFGSLLTDKASSGISSIIVQLVCFTSGMYFNKEMLGKVFMHICEYLPFESALTILKGVMTNHLEIITSRNIIVFLCYTVTISALSIIVFNKNMHSDK